MEPRPERRQQSTLACAGCRTSLGILTRDGRRVRILDGVGVTRWETDRKTILTCPECARRFYVVDSVAVFVTVD